MGRRRCGGSAARWDTGHCSSPARDRAAEPRGQPDTALSPLWQQGPALPLLHPNMFLAGSRNPSVPPGAETSPLISQRALNSGFQLPGLISWGWGTKASSYAPQFSVPQAFFHLMLC